MTGHSWVRIKEAGTYLGAGFLVTRVYVITAQHCLLDMTSEEARLDLELPDGQVLSGRLCDADESADLALILVEKARSLRLPPAPHTDWPRPGVRWRGTYSPPGENLQLDGVVSHAPISYRRGGDGEEGTFTGLQLTVEQDVGNFSGYSGSPVDTDPVEVAEERPVVGILLEQIDNRVHPDLGSNVLIAASVRHAMALFPHFGVDWLRTGGQGSNAGPSRPGDERSAEPTSRKAARDTEVVLRSLREWEQTGLISEAEAQEHRGQTLREFRERALGDDEDV
jgi:hypothetical protein